MNENLDPTTSGFGSDEFDLEKKLRPLTLMISLVKTRC
jgi:Holliday junction DNA helicase RuvB